MSESTKREAKRAATVLGWPEVPTGLTHALMHLKACSQTYEAAKREVNQRAERGRDWMAQGRGRTVEQASAYTGMASAMDDRKQARAALSAATESVVRVWSDLLAEAQRLANPEDK